MLANEMWICLTSGDKTSIPWEQWYSAFQQLPSLLYSVVSKPLNATLWLLVNIAKSALSWFTYPSQVRINCVSINVTRMYGQDGKMSQRPWSHKLDTVLIPALKIDRSNKIRYLNTVTNGRPQIFVELSLPDLAHGKLDGSLKMHFPGATGYVDKRHAAAVQVIETWDDRRWFGTFQRFLLPFNGVAASVMIKFSINLFSTSFGGIGQRCSSTPLHGSLFAERKVVKCDYSVRWIDGAEPVPGVRRWQ